MNYNSIEDIFAAGVTNMEILRNNYRATSGYDTIPGIDWFTFNGIVASTIYINSNSTIGFGENAEHLKVNRNSYTALYSIYREEGTLCNYYKFLKIRWAGYSHWAYTDLNYELIYDVILWDTGDISLHMISIPKSGNNGYYSLIEQSTYSYTVSDASTDITFIKTNSGFEVNNRIITLELPYKERYLIRSESTYYTVINNVLTEVPVTELTSSVFLSSGIEYAPNISLLSNLSNPEIIYWRDVDIDVTKGLIIEGTPQLPQIIYYEQQDISNYSGIEKVEAIASDDVTFVITFDEGQTWKYYNNDAWNIATTESEGMSATTIKNIPSSAWAEIATSATFSFRCALHTKNSNVDGIYIKYV